jgi:zinc transport system substrate-binding protein
MSGFAVFLTANASLAVAPKVVVTIKPIHSLAAAILAGVTEPKLLIDGGASPHAYALRPSDAQALSNADAVVRVSENLEAFLGKAITTLQPRARLIDLEHTPGLTLLPVRVGEFAHDHDEEGEEADDGHHHNHEGYDVHFWLDPANAIAIAKYLAQQFTEMDPEHGALYEANKLRLLARLSSLDDEIRAHLNTHSKKPFIVFHDVTQYLEKRYGLNGLGAITLSPERAPGAKRLAAIRATIKQAKAICVFAEPQFPPKLVKMLTEGTNAKEGVLDEVGASEPAGPDQYFALMRADTESLTRCLGS